jgi:hypothetical protein
MMREGETIGGEEAGIDLCWRMRLLVCRFTRFRWNFQASSGLPRAPNVARALSPS